ncbi:unnamed protein product [Microthlaspi erraticum]|uniref:Ubiquitin-like protease family profile domain-containing protein n=1 Tax=Microthlaspi erraticum TaxID=1685480 RepID=A0A6D2KJ78_9BRAS|nr:unnamed protein product [Microthlaspi erraticum]
MDGIKCTQTGGLRNITEDVCGRENVDGSARLEDRQGRDEESPTEMRGHVDEISCTQSVVKNIVQVNEPIQPCTHGEREGEARTGGADEKHEKSMEDDGDTQLRALIDNIVAGSAEPKSLNSLEIIASDVNVEKVVDSKGVREGGSSMMEICEPSDVSARVESEQQGTGVEGMVSERESMGEECVFDLAQTDPSVGKAPVVRPSVVETEGNSHLRVPVHEKTTQAPVVQPLAVETEGKSHPRVPVHEKTTQATVVQPLSVETEGKSHPRVPVHDKTTQFSKIETGSKPQPRVTVHEKTVIFGEEHLRGQCMVVRKEVEAGNAVLPTTPPAARVLTGALVVDSSPTSNRATHITVSDSSPPPKRSAHIPSVMETELAKALVAAPRLPASSLVYQTDAQLFHMLKKTLAANKDFLHISQDKYDLDNSFFLDLAEKQKWVSTKHMEVLMTYLGDKHADLLSKENSMFASPWLVNHLQGKYRKFKAAINKGMIRWDDCITKFVVTPGQTWLEEVHTVYCPMIWDNEHWVGLGLAIHLGSRFVEVLDPLPSLNKDGKVERYMAPVVEMLPHIISRFCPSATQKRNNKPFTFKRVANTYENHRSGDCGPVAVKFMEIHAYNDPPPHLSGLTDELVGDSRKNYAMELYRGMVLPIYFPTSPPLSPVVEP